jgi:acetyltransferase-like isoleucine patch superfamily enzyme
MLGKIKTRLLKLCLPFYCQLKDRFEKSLSDKIINQFASSGKNITIPYPFHILNPEHIYMGDNVCALYNLRLEAIDEYADVRFVPKIVIGNNVSFNTDCHIGCINMVTIEDGVLIASRVFITDHFHGDTTGNYFHLPPAFRPLTSKGAVLIKRNAWIGEGVVILPGVTIGENSIIGANSVVTKSVSDNVVAAGNPCKELYTIKVSSNK